MKNLEDWAKAEFARYLPSSLFVDEIDKFAKKIDFDKLKTEMLKNNKESD